jgi:Tfp pilus assembly protein PilF
VRLQHEQAQVALQQGKIDQARRLYANILKKQPDFASAHNNLAMVDALEGKLGVAIRRCEGVIKQHPDNIHALSNLVRFLCLSGKMIDAEEWGKKLRETVTDAPEELLKKAEGLAYLGDDEGVLEAFHKFESVAGKGRARLEDPLFYHLAAAASMRLDDDRAARKYWRAALKLDPDFELASANMEDLKKPVGKRNAPWYFSFPYWVTAKTMLDLAEMAQRIPDELSDEAATRKAEQALANFARRHQEIEGMLSAMLDRGDEASRTLALQIGTAIGTEKSLAALKEFGLGKRGPDDLRWDALTEAGDAGLLPTAEVKV